LGNSNLQKQIDDLDLLDVSSASSLPDNNKWLVVHIVGNKHIACSRGRRANLRRAHAINLRHNAQQPCCWFYVVFAGVSQLYTSNSQAIAGRVWSYVSTCLVFAADAQNNNCFCEYVSCLRSTRHCICSHMNACRDYIHQIVQRLQVLFGLMFRIVWRLQQTQNKTIALVNVFHVCVERGIAFAMVSLRVVNSCLQLHKHCHHVFGFGQAIFGTCHLHLHCHAFVQQVCWHMLSICIMHKLLLAHAIFSHACDVV
jgi:hypothetical protein